MQIGDIMNILFLSNWFPYPSDNGSKLRIFNLLRGLAGRHQVSLLSYIDRPELTLPPQLINLCREVQTVPERPFNRNSARALLGFFNPKPRVLVDRFVPEMAERIHRDACSGRYDIIIASQWYMAAYQDCFNGLPAIFEEAELGVFQDRVRRAGSSLQSMRHRLTLTKMELYLRTLLPRFRSATVVSEKERALLSRAAPASSVIEVIPNGVSLGEYAGIRAEPEPDSLIFTGSFRYFANYQAMLWFVKDVFPRVKEMNPQARLTITGDPAGRSFPQVPGVTHAGFLRDVRPKVAASWASIAPILTGGGTRLKILEAMALHTPVISTSKGAEGLDVKHEEHLLIADSPKDFAEATASLLADPDLRSRLAANAYSLVRERYDWSVILPRFLNLVERSAVRPGARAFTPYERVIHE